MSNDLCCILNITQKDYEQMLGRFPSFGVNFITKRSLIFATFANPEQSKKTTDLIKPNNTIKTINRKFINPIVKVEEKNGCVLIMGGTLCLPSDPTFIRDCTFLRVENNFLPLMKDWSIFSELKESNKKILEIEVYEWGNMYQFEFCLPDDSEGDLLLIIRDLSSTNCNYPEKYYKIEKENIREKFNKHFKDLYAVFACSYSEYQPFLPPQNSSSQMNQEEQRLSQNLREGLKVLVDFNERLKEYVGKLEEFISFHPENSTAIQFWMVRLAFITSFVYKEDINYKYA